MSNSLGRSFRVLLIDDNPGDIDILRDAINQQNIRIELLAFTNGQKALEFLRSGQRVDLIISDLNMPEINGADLVARITADALLNKIPVAIMSSSCYSQLPLRVRDKVKVPYFTKASNWETFLLLAREIHDSLVKLHVDTSPDAVGRYLSDRLRPPLP